MGGSYYFLRRNALLTTLTDDAAIAKPANAGGRMVSAARGMPTVLYMNAKNRF